MEKAINIDYERLKKSQVSKIKKCIIEIINKNSNYYENKKYAKNLLRTEDTIIEYNEVKE